MTSAQGPFSNLLPPGWHLTHLILLDPEWQAIAKDEEHVAIGTGDSIEEAIAKASWNATYGVYAGRLFHLARLEPIKPTGDVLARLGLVERPLLRRKVT